MLFFKNKGLIDLTALVTFGVSAKETNSPIGYFGTGAKYSISVVLRNGGEFVVWRGKERHEFTLQRQNIRGQDFDMICLDGVPCGFTSRVGINWEPWMAFRELYCNAIDEDGGVSADPESPEDDTTIIAVHGLDTEYHERDSIVLGPALPVLAKLEGVTVHGMSSRYIYCRGVRVHTLAAPSHFTYNFGARLQLTEDRTLAQPHMVEYYLANAVLKTEDRDFLRAFLTAPDKTMERGADLKWTGAAPSKPFLDATGEARRVQPAGQMNQTALALLQNHRPDPVPLVPVVMDQLKQVHMSRSLGFLEMIGWTIDPETIVVVNTLEPGVMGRALPLQNKIAISIACFDLGTKYVASTILEKHLELERRMDGTEMQQYLMDSIIKLGEKIVGEPL